MTDSTSPAAPPSPPEPALDPDDYVFSFTPAPSRKRLAGWTTDRQRRFILALRVMGVVSSAAKAVGMTHQSAYKLRGRTDAAGFAAAWDRALDDGRDRAFALAMDRALNGYQSPRFYRGRFVGTVHRYDNRLALAALNAPERIYRPPPGRSGMKGDE